MAMVSNILLSAISLCPNANVEIPVMFAIVGGKPLLELNRILRPGGYFLWSATPVYEGDEKHKNVWDGIYPISYFLVSSSTCNL